jgi:membrane-associated protease RseP (regulator of RpoE activity)
MGAQRAGLQKDDVIVAIGGKDASTWPAMANALHGLKAGDSVTVDFYRGGQRLSVLMELSPRPMPEVPLTPEALAEAMRTIYAEVEREIARCFEGATDAEATWQPVPGEWSALEVVAHLIAEDRENQAWITDLINDDERWSDRYENPTTVASRLKAIVATYPTTGEMLEEMRRSKAETVAMLAALPPELVARKGSYVRLGRGLMQLTLYHVQEHTEQIKEAIRAARA